MGIPRGKTCRACKLRKPIYGSRMRGAIMRCADCVAVYDKKTVLQRAKEKQPCKAGRVNA